MGKQKINQVNALHSKLGGEGDLQLDYNVGNKLLPNENLSLAFKFKMRNFTLFYFIKLK